MPELMCEVERVYNFLFVKFCQDKKSGNLLRAARIYDALGILRELYPSTLKKYNSHAEVER